MSVSQLQVPSLARWRRLCLASFVVAGITAQILWAAYHRLHHDRENQAVNLGVVLTVWDVLTRCAVFPARGEAVGRTGLDGRPVPVEQDGSAGPALKLLAEQLIEPLQATRG